MKTFNETALALAVDVLYVCLFTEEMHTLSVHLLVRRKKFRARGNSLITSCL